MKRINILDEHTSNKIAAGEVVERPSSVVKELIENSIDAESKNITIEIEDGGLALIRVIDDGYGIHSEDIKKAFLPHATSKINSVEDIYSISTLGFRGEALPSIASVSKVLLKSKVNNCDIGSEILVEGGNIKEIREIGMNTGSIIEVKDLFYNVPARKKFLKTSSRESALINDIVTRIALSNPSISFKLYNNSKKVLHTYGNNNLGDVIRTIYGKNISENLIYFSSNEDNISIYGYIGKEEISRGSRNNQSIFINNRYVKNKTIVVAIENAFKSFATVNKFPFFVLFINIYPEFIDVNIHPTKAEIKFKEDRVIFKKVFDTVHKAFKNEVFNEFYVPEETINKNESEQLEKISFNIEFNDFINKNNSSTYSKINKEEATLKYLDGITLDEVKAEEDLYNKLRSMKENGEILLKEDTFNSIGTKEIYKTKKIDYSNLKENKEVYNNLKLKENCCLNNNNNEYKTDVVLDKIAKFPELKVIGQFNKTYILAEYESILYIIDQHAAHEKILFEKYLNEIDNSNIIIQPVLIPTLIELTVDDLCYYEENIEIFKSAGFKVESFGGNTLALKEVPYFLGKLDSKNLFLSIIENLKSLGSGKTSEVKLGKVASLACKAAVKANDTLSEIEMYKLIEQLRYIEDPFHCPHGRPVIIKFTDYELDKKFRRIV
ncbi:DNA mismatch repair endonuclease MutL [Clostridium carnis]